MIIVYRTRALFLILAIAVAMSSVAAELQKKIFPQQCKPTKNWWTRAKQARVNRIKQPKIVTIMSQTNKK